MNREVRLPRPGRGQMRRRLQEMLRVDHAGEMAAVQIYRGQKDVFRAAGRADMADDMARMETEEQVHLDRFNALLTEHETRPTLMTPIWRLAAYGLGVGTALLGEKAAHACTEAVETVMASKDGDPARIVAETADLWFHCLINLAHHGLRPADVLAELERREGLSGLDEKAARTAGPANQEKQR